MIKASLKGRCDGDVTGAVGTITVDGGDVNLRVTMTDSTFLNGSSLLNDLSLSLEKPASFVIDYTLSTKDVRFQFMDTVTVMDKPLNFTYTHWRGAGAGASQTALDGLLAVDSANKVSASYGLDTGDCKLKYSYVHKGLTTLEPSYDFKKNSWDLAVSRRVYGDDVVRASYQSWDKVLGLEWCRNSSLNGSFKISASMNLAEKPMIPKLSAESTLSFDM